MSIIELLEEVARRQTTIDMLKDAFYSVAERTHQQVEAFYVLHQIDDLERALGKVPDPQKTLMGLDNIAATIADAICRFDR